MNYLIAADSSSNLPADSGVAIVPLKIITDQREFLDDDGLDLNEMLSYLQSYKGRSGTSCPNVNDWLEAIGDAPRSFIVTITSGLSGCCNAAMQAKAVCEEQGQQVCVLDSLSTGPEMVLIIRKLQELSNAGVSFEDAKVQIRQYMTHTHLMFSLENLTNLARNGRVSPLVAKAAGLLGIRIVGKASDKGTLEPMHKCRGQKKALETLAREMTAMGFRGGRVHIAHCSNEEAAAELSGLLTTAYPGCDIKVEHCTGLCSFYAEKGGLLVGFEDSL